MPKLTVKELPELKGVRQIDFVQIARDQSFSVACAGCAFSVWSRLGAARERQGGFARSDAGDGGRGRVGVLCDESASGRGACA